MKPTISLYHVAGLLPAQYRNDPATRGITFSSHARAERKDGLKEQKEQLAAISCKESIIPSPFEYLRQINLSVLSIHSFVHLIHPIDGLNLGGIYLIYKQNAKDNTYSFSPINEPSIPRWAIDPIDIYPGLELELKRGNRNYQWYGIEPGIHKVRSVSIDNLQCNISVINGEAWSHVNDGDLYLPAKESQGA